MPEPELQPPLRPDYATPGKRDLLSSVTRVIKILAAILVCGIAIAIFTMPVHRPIHAGPRRECLSNLQQIGLGILLYCQDYHGNYPDSFQTLLLTEQITPSVFICPSSNDNPSTAPTTQAQAAEMSTPGHVSYIYLGKGLTDKTVLSDQVIAYEPLANHGDGIDVLLGDGTARFVNVKRATKIISDANAGVRPVMLPP